MFSSCSSPALDMSSQVQWTGIARSWLVAKSLHFRHTNNLGFIPVNTWPSSHFKMNTTMDISNNSDFSTYFKFTLLNALKAEYLLHDRTWQTCTFCLHSLLCQSLPQRFHQNHPLWVFNFHQSQGSFCRCHTYALSCQHNSRTNLYAFPTPNGSGLQTPSWWNS